MRDVGARDQQHECDRSRGDEQRPPDAVDEVVQHRHHLRAVPGVRRRHPQREIRRRGLDILPAGAERYAVAQPPEREERMPPDPPRLERQVDRYPDVGLHASARRHDTDDAVGFVVQQDGAGDGPRIRGEPCLPEAVAEDDDLCRSGLILTVREGAADDCADAEDVEVVRGNRERIQHRRLAGASQRELLVLIRGDAVEGMRPLAPGDEFMAGQGAAGRVGAPFVQRDQALRIAVGQRLQQHGVEQAEDGHGGGDAERQDADHHRAERARVAQSPEGVPDVEQQCAHARSRARALPASGVPGNRRRARRLSRFAGGRQLVRTVRDRAVVSHPSDSRCPFERQPPVTTPPAGQHDDATTRRDDALRND